MRKDRALKIIGLMAAAVWAVSCRAPEPAPQRSDQPLTTQQIAQLAKPAVVMVVTTHKVRVSFPSDVQVRDQRIMRAVQRFAISRGIQYEWEFSARAGELIGYLIEDMLANLSEYILPSDSVEKVFEFSSTGSGVFASADGYLITNAHVVSPERQELETWVDENFLKPAIALIAKDTAEEIAKSLENAGYPVAGDQEERLQAELAKFFLRHSAVKQIETGKPRILMGYRDGDTPRVKSLPAEVVVKGGPIPEKDVAILKVSGENFFTIFTSEESRLNQGDTVYAMGYPSAVTLHKEFEESSLQEPTLTQGTCSARRTLKEGWEAVQIDAEVQAGGSGGPILDNRGRMVGIAAFSVRDPETKDDADFIVPASVVREFLQRANVSATEGQVNPLYREAIAAIEQEDFQTALEKLNQVEALRPGIPVVQELRATAQKAVLEGRGRKRQPEQWVWIAGGVGGLLLVIMLLTVVFLMRRRARLRTSSAQSATPPTAAATQIQPAAAFGASSATPYRLIGMAGAASGQQVPVPPNGLTIGREADNDLVLNDSLVSRRHARIVIESNQLVIYDLGSMNGTRVNGQRIQRQPLNEGDLIQIGDSQLRVTTDATIHANLTD